MKLIKLFSAGILFLLVQSIEAQNIKLTGNHRTQTQIVRNGNDGFELTNIIREISFEKKVTQRGVFMQLNASNFIKSFQKGNPDLPVYSSLIEIPQDANVRITIVSYDEEIIDLNTKGVTNQIIPSQPSMRKNASQSDKIFYYNDLVYSKNEFYKQGDIAVYNESGQMRDKRLGRIEVRPFQYNPVTNQLKILNNLKIKVDFIGANMLKTNELYQKYGSVFSSLPTQMVAYQLNMQRREFISNTPITYVIVADRAYEQVLQDFVVWKTKKGFKVIEAYTDDSNVGNTVASIKAYCSNLYNNPPAGYNPPSFILVVGDIEIIPATRHTEVDDNPYSDLDLAEYTGDYLPEVNFGRWSADNPQQVADIVAKSVRYEKLQMANIDYLRQTLLVAGDDEDYEDTYGGGAIYYADHYYTNPAHNINSHTFLQNTIETWPNQNAQAHDSIITNINSGVSLVNYTAHCSPDGWEGPLFTQNDLNQYITNNDKFGIWIGNCCQSYKFDENESFGEMAIRKPNAGVVGYIGGSQFTYWDEDYWWGVGIGGNIVAQPSYENTAAGLYDAQFHDRVNEVNDPSKWYLSTYQMIKAGNLAVESSTSIRKPYYWVIYQVAGDPSIIPFVGYPQPMQVATSQSTIFLGMTSLNVTAAPYAYVALSQNNILIATASTDASGNATLNFDTTSLQVGNADLVVTAQNKVPYISTISVADSNAPYIVFDAYTTDINPDFGQTINLNLALKNIVASGTNYHALNTQAVLSTTDAYVTITQNTANYGTINADNSVNVNNAYTITIADNIPDQHVVHFNIDITGDDSSGTHYTWNDTFALVANAPNISIASLIILNDDNNNGMFDAGETAQLNYSVTNSGHAQANFSGILSESNDPNNYITLSGTTVAPVSIAPGNAADFIFNDVMADAATPLESQVDLQLIVNAGSNHQYTNTSIQTLQIGVIPIYNISTGGTISVCSGNFYDSGLDSGDYLNYENYTMTFLPSLQGHYLQFYFNTFDVEISSDGIHYDWLKVYDGVDTNATLLGDFSADDGAAIPSQLQPITATNQQGALTFVFHSDESITKHGWDASISCVNPNALSEINQIIGIYPNPTTGIFTIKTKNLDEAELYIYTISGKMILKRTVNKELITVDLTKQAKGVYFVKIVSNQGIYNSKIIIK